VGKGYYCLYHGNMAVSENEEAAVWLIMNVFSKLNLPFVIAGKKISPKLHSLAKKYKNCKLISDPPIDELNSLIRDAHVNILPSKNNTGVKLKLLHALFEGRFCVTNTNGIAGSHITSGLHIVNEPTDYVQLIQRLFEEDFTTAHMEERLQIQTLYDNKLNAQKLSDIC
jgi:glycosyltransferase involved in cell wall biosynthesis